MWRGKGRAGGVGWYGGYRRHVKGEGACDSEVRDGVQEKKINRRKGAHVET